MIDTIGMRELYLKDFCTSIFNHKKIHAKFVERPNHSRDKIMHDFAYHVRKHNIIEVFTILSDNMLIDLDEYNEEFNTQQYVV